VPTKAYDWTYTSTYSGHCTCEAGAASVQPDRDNPAHAIPTAELSRRDPILFYAEVPLFEDELHDNGSSSIVARLRVMPTSLFILMRFSLRVDNVLFRVHDTRIYHSFASSPSLIVKETNGWEAPYASVKRRLPDKHDLTLLTDSSFVAQTLTSIEGTQEPPGVTGWRGLGRNIDVIQLPGM